MIKINSKFDIDNSRFGSVAVLNITNIVLSFFINDYTRAPLFFEE